jgi:hypothetical protein
MVDLCTPILIVVRPYNKEYYMIFVGAIYRASPYVVLSASVHIPKE